MDDGVKKFCPNCSQLYNLQLNFSSKPKGNLPLLLPCGHSMCENCIVNTVKCLEPIECKVCMCDANVKINDLNTFMLDKNVLYSKFPINVHMVGELAVSQMKDSYSTRKQPDDDFFIDLKTLLKCAAEQGNCVECGVATSKMCKECVTILCDACFNKTHKNYIVFKNHVLQSIETTMLPSTCKQHLQKPLDYYCKDCKKCVCTDCMILGGEKSCKNHDVVSLQEINETFLEDLNEISPKVDETYRRLTKTAVDVGYLLYNFQNDAGSAKDLTNILADVEQHFSKLFSIIQKHKEEIVNIILYLKFSEKNSLQRAKSEIANSIKKANNVLELIAIATDTKNIKRINMPALLEEAKEVVNTPWYLDKKETDKEPLKVTVNEDLCSLVSDYVHLEGNVKSVYKMYSTAELGDNVEIPPAPATPVLPPELVKDARLSKPNKPKTETPKVPALFTNAPKYRNKSGSVSSVNSSCSEKSNRSYIVQNQYHQPPIVQPVAPFQENQHPQQLSEGAQELIYITHIVDPHNFFVQRACFQRLVKDMVREFRNAVSFAKPSVNHIAPGKTYLAFNKADNMWQRCRVLGIDMKPNKNPVVQVFCFDFGSIELISADKLRLLPPSKIQCPYPLAINCSLANCEPRSGKWTSDDSFLIQNIIDNKQAVLHVRRIIPLSNVDFKLDCDVTTFENGVSVAHALVFHERAKMPNPKLWYPKIMGVDEIPKLYNSSELKSEEEVYITHVINPDKFYVRKHHLQEIYDKLTEELEQEYSLASTTGTVYLPEIGKVYAVNLEKCQEEVSASWARGVATELPGHKRVRVRLPDCGRTLLLHWSSLRYLQTKFTTLSALAIECHLAGITPPNKQWSKVSVEFFKKYQGTLLELQVEDNRNKGRHNRGSVGVTLYDKSDTENSVCINNEMIKHKFGVSFGIYKFNTSPEEQVVTNKSPLIEPKPSKPQKNKITILKKEMPEKVKSPESMDDINLQAKDKGPLRLEAKVLNYQSPSHIYISLVHQQKTFNELFEKMQKYYSKSNKNKLKEDWKIGDRCSTLCQQSQTWRRTIIMELKDGNAKLFYSDFACVETVPISSLKELPPEFSKIGDAAIKCHLSGIMPAVGDEWPLITKEYLKELLDAYKRIFVTKMGTFKDKSMPIQLWVYHTVQGGALEPNKSTWRCLNEKILEQGLCVPDQSQAVPTDNNAEDSQDMLSFLNITGSVNEWLLLEPLPMIPLEKEKVDSGSKTNSPSPSQENEDNYYDTKENPSPSNVMYVTDWLPPEPLNCTEFTALPTYIDNDGIIYLYDISQQDTLDLIRKALDVRFKDPDPKAKFTKWSVGEPCVALFFLDNRYYRGRVIEVNEETSKCVIHYIDYGNEETCSFENLRKSVPLHQIPTQAHKCVLNRIRPVGKQWDRQTLDYIHKSIVEKKCFVKVVGDAVNGVIPIELKYDKLWINDHLVDFELAEYKDGTKAPVMKYCPVKKNKEKIQEDTTQCNSGPDYVVDDPDTDQLSSCQNSFDVSSIKAADWNKLMEDEESATDGKFITFPKHSDNEYMCNIAVINDVNTLELNIVWDEDTSRLYEQMFEEIQTESMNMPPLDGVFENKACIAVFPEDGRWYRAVILQHCEKKNRVKVRYVDYGNIEIISLTDTREICEELAKLPPATISAKLFGVRLNADTDISVITENYAQVFLDKGPFHVNIMGYEGPVPLVELRHENSDLVYKKLIENNIFIKCD
ncbi:RING finger protein 17 [Spodoptera litura]|uniref:RING finger protein 17 n=1 Tax=Spodoptera litura TaxID=69820 RepID=A0A9J7ED30_SPOLT|nr:RING finger protein 17 [Spodoptera litura]